jgi:hypothetical protein
MDEVEHEGHQRARLTLRVPPRPRLTLRIPPRPRLTLRIPPRAHKICALCKSDFTVPINENDGSSAIRCTPCRKSEKCSNFRKSQGLTLGRIKLGLGKREFSTGMTFVALSRVKAFDSIIIVDQVDYSKVQRLEGKHMQYRLDDYARRHHLART